MDASTSPSRLPVIAMGFATASSVFDGLVLAGLVLAASLAGLAGCAPMVAEAPFVRQPGTVEAGSLLGPFSGQVVDAANGKPLQGAIVFGSWGFEVGRGLTSPAGAVTTSVETDSDGRYEIAPLADTPDGARRVARFTLLVWKRGYVGWRSDRRFDDPAEPRRDFSQLLNVTKLDRVRPGVSAVQQLRHLGGGGALRRALDPEFMQAALELGGGRSAKSELPLLDASVLLSEEELRAKLHSATEYSVERLADLARSPSYDSRHFRAVGKGETYDAAYRMWHLGSPQAAEARYALLEKEVPHAEARDEIGDRSLRGYDGRIWGVAVLDRKHAVVIELTCGADLCRDLEQSVAVLQRLLERANALVDEEQKSDEKKTAKPEAKGEEKPDGGKDEPAEDTTKKPDDKPFQLRPPQMRKR